MALPPNWGAGFSADPFSYIQPYISEFGEPGSMGMGLGPHGMNQEIRRAAARSLGYTGQFGEGGHHQWMEVPEWLDPFMLPGDSWDIMTPRGISQAEHRGLARAFGYGGPFGGGAHNEWLASTGQGPQWQQFLNQKVPEVTQNPRKQQFQWLLGQLSKQKAQQGGNWNPQFAPPPAPEPMPAPVTPAAPAPAPVTPPAAVPEPAPEPPPVAAPPVTPDNPLTPTNETDPWADIFAGLIDQFANQAPGTIGPMPQLAPESYWSAQGLGPGADLTAQHYAYNPEWDAYYGDVRLASKLLGYEGDFGDYNQQMWLNDVYGGDWTPVLEKAAEIQAARNAYNAEIYGIDPSQWAPGGVVPSQMDPLFGVPYGISRKAMTNLGFMGPFGGGAGHEFVSQVGLPVVQQAIYGLQNPGAGYGLTDVTLAPMPAQPPPEDFAFQPNYPLFFNPQLMSGLVGSGELPEYAAPWYGQMDVSDMSSGAGQYLDQQQGQVEAIQDTLAQLESDPWGFLGIKPPYIQKGVPTWGLYG